MLKKISFVFAVLFFLNSKIMAEEFKIGDYFFRIDVYKEDILRFRISEQPIEEQESFLIVKQDWQKPEYKFFDNKDNVVFETSKLSLTIDKNPLKIKIVDNQKTILESEKNNPVSFATSKEEHFFGLGQKYGPLDKSGKKVILWNQDVMSEGGQVYWFSEGDSTYINVPFFMSTSGYGFFVNDTSRLVFNFGKKNWNFSSQNSLKDYFFIYGPDFKDILFKYTEITGRSLLPPRWSFGIWMAKWHNTDDEVLEVAKRLRKEEIPADVLIIEPGWLNCYVDLQFSSSFKNAAQIIQEVKNMGFKVALWETPFVNKDCPLYEEGVAKDVFIKKEDGSVYPVKWWLGSGKEEGAGLIDFTNPQAGKWWWEKQEYLIDLGIDTFKTDDGELVPEDAVFYNGKKGTQMHNLYPLYYNRTMFENLKEKTKKRAVVWARSGYAGTQRYPVVWAGDQESKFESIEFLLRAGQSIGLSGISFWGHDVGGYVGDPTPECYIRWTQFSMLSPFAQTNGIPPGSREPWLYGDQATKIYKKYADLRYQLLPYLYTYAWESTQTGLPLMRALVLEYQNDPQVYNQDLEYLLGEYLLIAPIYQEYSQERDIYLPAGKWIDFWDGKEYEGEQKINYKANLDCLPIFVKKGAIIPFGPSMEYVDEVTSNPLTLEIYPNGTSSFTLYEDDGESYAYQEGEFCLTEFKCQETKDLIEIFISKGKGEYKGKLEARDYILQVHTSLPQKIEINGGQISSQQFEYQQDKNIVLINLPSVKEDIIIKIWK